MFFYTATQSLPSGNVNQLFMGLNDIVQEAIYVWESTQQLMTYENWYIGDPGNTRTENCVVMRRLNGAWVDYPCTHQRLPFCYMDP